MKDFEEQVLQFLYRSSSGGGVSARRAYALSLLGNLSRHWENSDILSARPDFVADTRFAAMELQRRSFHKSSLV
jgi:hypothetical protein